MDKTPIEVALQTAKELGFEDETIKDLEALCTASKKMKKLMDEAGVTEDDITLIHV